MGAIDIYSIHMCKPQ